MSFRNIDIPFISKLMRTFSLGLFVIFFHSAVVLPILEYQQTEISIVDTPEDKESENKEKELEDDLHESIIVLLPPIVLHEKFMLIKKTDAKHELHHTLFSPPPERG